METAPFRTAGGQRPVDAPSRPWTLPLVLAVALGVTTAIIVFRQKQGELPANGVESATSAEHWTPPPEPQAQTVSLVIDFGNGVRREFTALPWREGMTVGDLMRAARQFRPGIAFTQQGEGKMALLTSLDGVANGAADGRFWMYEVDGRQAKVSFEVQPLAAGQRTLWAFKQRE
jgi:hypothetical protein